MAFFSKIKSKTGGSPSPQRDPSKARRFFEHAQSVADARNHDYAIDCYLNGLKHDPDNMSKHEALRDVALKRKVAGGKPGTLSEKYRNRGKDAVSRLLHAEMLWSKDPLNVQLMVEVMCRAVEAEKSEEDLNLAELAYWVGGMILEAHQAGQKLNKDTCLKTRDLFAEIEAYDKAVDACHMALQMDMDSTVLQHELKNLEAELMLQRGGYDEKAPEGGYRDHVKDMQKQHQLEQQDSISASEGAVGELIETRRAEYQESPEDLDLLQKLVAALLRAEADGPEEEAIGLLEGAWESSKQYRYRMQAGDVRMRRLGRAFRKLNAHVKANPEDSDALSQLKQLAKDKLKLELQEFAQRVEHYPTDMAMRYELGRRLFAAKKYDDAIASLQQAKAHPKHRAAANEYLGRCYIAKDWHEEAIDTLQQGIDTHQLSDDRLAMDLRYYLMTALRGAAAKNRSLEMAQRAQKAASEVLQTNINYRDIRSQMESIRALADELRAESG